MAQQGLTLIKLFLDVVLVRLVPTDAVQTFCGQTCKHKAPWVNLTFKRNLRESRLNCHLMWRRRLINNAKQTPCWLKITFQVLPAFLSRTTKKYRVPKEWKILAQPTSWSGLLNDKHASLQMMPIKFPFKGLNFGLGIKMKCWRAPPHLFRLTRRCCCCCCCGPEY